MEQRGLRSAGLVTAMTAIALAMLVASAALPAGALLIHAPRAPAALTEQSLSAQTASLQLATNKASVAAGDATVVVADVAKSILHSAREKIVALKKVAAKHAATAAATKVTAKHAAHRVEKLDDFLRGKAVAAKHAATTKHAAHRVEKLDGFLLDQPTTSLTPKLHNLTPTPPRAEALPSKQQVEAKHAATTKHAAHRVEKLDGLVLVKAKHAATTKHAAHRVEKLDGFVLDAHASAALTGAKKGHSAQGVEGFVLDTHASAALTGAKKGPSAQAALAAAMKPAGKGGKTPTSSLLKRMPGYVTKANKKLAKVVNLEEGIAQHKFTTRSLVAAVEKAQAQQEAGIAQHKFTTRSLVAAVEKAQAKQEAELSSGLRDQTDDLIIAKINQLRSKKAPDTQQYVMSNSLTGVEKKALKSPESSPTRKPS
ncbi:hypothetical protein T484DRAFT_1817791 [Baffinella frigidus]|nr:hypothetical protein T484DRAFT_1817791 [Cryptophyta sp. CCMP2293]